MLQRMQVLYFNHVQIIVGDFFLLKLEKETKRYIEGSVPKRVAATGISSSTAFFPHFSHSKTHLFHASIIWPHHSYEIGFGMLSDSLYFIFLRKVHMQVPLEILEREPVFSSNNLTTMFGEETTPSRNFFMVRPTCFGRVWCRLVALLTSQQPLA